MNVIIQLCIFRFELSFIIVWGLSELLIYQVSFLHHLATELRMATKDSYKYDQFWQDVPGKTSQVFRVKAKSNANILLAATSEVTNNKVYEITIGKNNNTKTVIRNGNHFLGIGLNIKETMETPGILAEDEFRTFWVSWSLGEIRFGRGAEVGADQVISWLDPDPHPVHALSVATEKVAAGQWEFYQLKGQFQFI